MLILQRIHGSLLLSVRPTKIMTTTADSRQWLFTKCAIDLESGQPVVVSEKRGNKPTSWATGCGTDIRLWVPGSDEALEYAESRLRDFFARFHLAYDRAAGVTFACEVREPVLVFLRCICLANGSLRSSLVPHGMETRCCHLWPVHHESSKWKRLLSYGTLLQ